jgi:hypothetical protein
MKINGEVVFIRLIDIGRFINLKKVTEVFPGVPDIRTFESKDTPVVYLPKPLAMNLPEIVIDDEGSLKKADMKVKLYEDGVISFVARLTFEDLQMTSLHTVHVTHFTAPEGEFTVGKWMDFHFKLIYSEIKSYIDEGGYVFTPPESEEYTCFCITDDVGDPNDFLEHNSAYFAGLLLENQAIENLHQSQITSTLSYPFSFLQNDLVIFDFDRCLIFDPQKDYEDILFICELANYQMLNLRDLDRILDHQLDIAEDDIRQTFEKSNNPVGKLTKKLGEWLKLRYDMLFILENLENVSKIIGDFYLGNLFEHICSLFELDQWSASIRHRLDVLGDVYTMARQDSNDRIMLYMEIVLAVIFIMQFIMAIFGVNKLIP